MPCNEPGSSVEKNMSSIRWFLWSDTFPLSAYRLLPELPSHLCGTGGAGYSEAFHSSNQPSWHHVYSMHIWQPVNNVPKFCSQVVHRLFFAHVATKLFITSLQREEISEHLMFLSLFLWFKAGCVCISRSQFIPPIDRGLYCMCCQGCAYSI